MTHDRRRSRRASAWLLVAVAALTQPGGTALAQDGRRTVRAPRVSLWPAAERALTRRIRPSAWDTIARLGDALLSARVRAMHRLQADDSGFVIAAANGVAAFDTRGRLRWSIDTGFTQIRDLKLTPAGTVVVLDPRGGHVTWLAGHTGRLIRRVPLGDVGYTEQLVPNGESSVTMQSQSSRYPFVRLDTSGRVVSRAPFPWAGYAALEPLARGGLMAGDARSGRWVFGFYWGDGWFAFGPSGTEAAPRRYVERQHFPHVVVDSSAMRISSKVVRPRSSVSALWMKNGLMSTLLATEAPDLRNRVIDVYAESDGAYRYSYVLPARAEWLAVADARYYVVPEGGRPQVLVLRRRAPK